MKNEIHEEQHFWKTEYFTSSCITSVVPKLDFNFFLSDKCWCFLSTTSLELNSLIHFLDKNKFILLVRVQGSKTDNFTQKKGICCKLFDKKCL